MIYDYKCEDCDNVDTDVIRKMAERNEPHSCSKCGSLNSKRVINKTPSIGDSWSLGIKKPDSDFRDMLSTIAKRSPGSNVNDRK